jgi:predicted signal transduction protein with EAL and GGDEF domain
LVLLFCLGLAAAVYAFRRVGDLSQEIAQRRVAEEEAHRLARYDVLTGLANRRRFLEEFDDLTRNLPKGCTTGQGYLFGKVAPAEVTNEALGKEAGRQAVAISTKLKRA